MYTLFFFFYVALFSNANFYFLYTDPYPSSFSEYSPFNALISAIVPGVIPPIILSAANNGRTNI